jgi:hypothetical protein
VQEGQPHAAPMLLATRVSQVSQHMQEWHSLHMDSIAHLLYTMRHCCVHR